MTQYIWDLRPNQFWYTIEKDTKRLLIQKWYHEKHKLNESIVDMKAEFCTLKLFAMEAVYNIDKSMRAECVRMECDHM